MGKTPQQLIPPFDRYRTNKSIYITQTELYNWAYLKTHSTQEGEPYHDALSIFMDAVDAIAEFFDGSLGTFVNPMTGETIDYPEVCDSTDVKDFFNDDFNSRLIYWPLFNSYCDYTEDNDYQWYRTLEHWAGRVKRFCKFNGLKYTKLMQLSAIEYNPLADYWSKEKELNANAPYATISNPSSGEYGNVSSWTASGGKQDYKNTTTINSATPMKNEHFTTTYDDAAATRLESYDKQTGSTENKNEIPQSAALRKKEIEGNDANPMQDIIQKEFDIAYLWNIFEGFMDELAKEIYLQVYRTP